MDYKNTLNLPRTDFPMKADLVAREPQRLERWERENIYAQIQAARKGAPKFVLHDGPPFANGDVHVGTALNKILKDIIVKYKTLRGYDAPYVPGWDCHGLPIEFKVTQELRKAASASGAGVPPVPSGAGVSPAGSGAAVSAASPGVSQAQFDPASIRTACEAYARKYIDLQRTQFKRLGVFGDWEHPYLTLNKEYEADELRLFADLVAQGFVYRGKKPVYWSIPCRTALAEAEVEYGDHVSQSVYVKFRLKGEPNTFLLIWTTTPWTLAANLAVAYNSGFFYSLVHANGDTYLVCDSLLDQVSQKCGWGSYQIIRTVAADELATLEYEHPFCARTGRLHDATFVENSTGTGFVHIAPGHGLEDYGLGRSVGLPIYSPVNDDGCLAHTGDLPVEQQMPADLLGKSILEKHGKSDANEAVLHELRVRHALAHQENYHHSYPHCWRSKTPVIFRAMDQWFIRIDHVPNAECGMRNAESEQLETPNPKPETFRQKALAEISRVKWIPDWGQSRIEGAVKTRPDWCISRQRSWGVPLPAFYDAQGNAILDAAIVRNAAALIEQHGSNVWFEKSATELWSLVKPADWTGPDAVTKSNDTLDVWIDSGSSSRAVLMRRPELQHGNASTSELPSLHDKLTGLPTTVAGAADFGGTGQGHGQTARPSLSQLADARRLRLRQLRQEARQAPRARGLSLPVIPLDTLGWKAGHAARAALKHSSEIFTEAASTRLAYVGEGMEAFVYRAPENPGVVYKFFPRNLEETGVALRFNLRLDAQGRLEFTDSYSDGQAELCDKLWLLNALGLPCEILGQTEEGAMVVKQAEVAEPIEAAAPEERPAQTGGLILYALNEEAFAIPAGIAPETKLLWLDGEFWLLGDLRDVNRMENGAGVTHIVDAIAAVIPPELISRSPELQRFLRDVEAHARAHQTAASSRGDELQHATVVGQASPPAAGPSTVPVEAGTANGTVAGQLAAGTAAPLPWQADVYLEGSDQHRGWFQSSLLLSLAGNGAAPFQTVLTHGFMVDADREKISKSKQGAGGYEKPQTAEAYVKKWGADVLRLWVASQDYRSDIVVSEERISKVAETYRALRNTLRYQLSNLYDFDPARHTVPDAQLAFWDRWILWEFSKLEAEIMGTWKDVEESRDPTMHGAYGRYEFHAVYQKISQFAAVHLSAKFHDWMKDGLYTDGANSPRRRSTQTALHRMVTRLCQMLAPILVFTAEEAWEFILGRPAPSVHLAEWEHLAFPVSEEEKELWSSLLAIREIVMLPMEKARQGKAFGKAVEAKIQFTFPNPEVHATGSIKMTLIPGESSIIVSAPTLRFLHERLADFAVILNSCQLPQPEKSYDPYFSIHVSHADGLKCERCWHWETDVGANTEHPTICGRCVVAVKQCANS